MDANSPHVVVIGAGHAGGSAVAFLRQFGWKAPITLIGEESALPYQRPPLSKALLKGEATEASLLLRPEKFYPAVTRTNWNSPFDITARTTTSARDHSA